MSDTAQKLLAGLLLFLITGTLANGLLLWRNVALLSSKLHTWEATTWPLERKLLVTDHVQLEARNQINAANVEELENELERIE